MIKEFEISNINEYINIIFKLKGELNVYLNNDNLFASLDNFVDNILYLEKEDINYDYAEMQIKEFIRNYRIYNLYQLNTGFSFFGKSKRNTYIEKNKTVFKDVELFYRGVYDGIKFNLLPSCFRGGNYGKESDYYHYIQTRCSSEFKNRNHLDSLVTLQHYDSPTRLLDITSNPLVALFFACKNYGCSNCDEAQFGYVYVFAESKSNLLFKDSDKAIMLSCLAKMSMEQQNEIYEECIKRIKNKGINAKFDQKNEAKCIEDLYHEIRTEINFEKKMRAIDLLQNYYVIPDYSNRRIERQSGAFILTGLADNQADYENKIYDEVIFKIRINNQKTILKKLDILGINESTLFPEMDKVSKYYVEKFK